VLGPIESAFRRIVPLLDDLVRSGLPTKRVPAFRPVKETDNQVRYDEVEVQRPDTERVMALVREAVFSSPEFEAAVKDVERSAVVAAEVAHRALQDAALGYVLYERDPGGAAKDISARLANEPVLCTWRAHLQGLVTTEPLTFSDGSVLRPPRDDDRLRAEPSDFASPMDEIEDARCPSILELRFRAQPGGLAQAIAERTFRVLRLICPAGISYRKLRMLSPFVLVPMSRGTFYSPSRGTPYTWRLERDDVPRVDELRLALWEQVPAFSEEPTDPVRIALDRYERALMENGRPEGRILYFVMALEALYSESENEVGYRLKQRAALFADFVDDDALAAARMVRQAYSLRSKYVHGNLPETATFDLLPLAELVRKTLIFLLVTRRGKEELIRDLDAGAISESERNHVRKDVRHVSGLMRAPGHRAM